jgi:eukaryotic-like serine/threonine-protein kinase
MDAASAAKAQRGRFPQLAKYEILDELGHGGMATVYRARDRRLGREVAIKVIHPHLRDSAEVVSRFDTEARAVAKLRHPNIVEVFDVGDKDESEVYLVVELLRGTTLRKILLKHPAMPPEVAAALALELLGGLAHAHANGVIHRDVKPENVLIEHRPGTAETPGEGVIVKLTDFGIAKLLDAQGVTSTGQVLGSPAHMAPEQIEGGDVDARADVFGMGVLLYECMVGHLPFEGSNPAQVLRRVLDGRYPEAQRERAVVGSRWSALIDRALAHAPADRFPDAVSMRDAIAAELDRLGVASAPAEIAAWLGDPQAFEREHAARMIAKLCALGNDERKAGAVLQAAGDYNRALAHAPDDPQLLRIVSAMNRDRIRARFAGRAGIALLVMLGLGGGTFGVGRLVRARRAPSAASAPAGAATIAVPAVGASSGLSPAPSDIAAAGERGGPSTTVRSRAAGPSAAREIASKLTERTLTLDLQPTMGVKLAIDEEPPADVTTGWQLRLDTKPHELTFTCEVCSSKQVAVAASDKDDTLVVSLPIKPATLIVQGDAEKTYQIVEEPQLVIRAGANSVALKSMYRAVTVRQMETDMRRHVRLQAGTAMPVSF